MFKIDGAGATAQNTFTKGDPVNAIPATEVTDEWLNAVQGEMVKVVQGSGLTLDKANSTQLFQALALLTTRGGFYSDGGTADTYVLTPTFTGFAPAAYLLGMQVRFMPANTNTGASTINVNGLGAKSIVSQSGGALKAGDLTAGESYTIYYDGTNFVLKIIAAPSALPVGTVITTGSTITPNGFVKTNGAALSRTTYAMLFANIAVTQPGAMTSGSPIITGLADTSRIQAGMPVSGVNLPVGGTVVSVDSGTQITVSVNATASVTQDMTVAPWGVGDSVNTFNAPELRAEHIRILDDGRGVDAGRILGAWQADELKSHTHNIKAPQYIAHSGGGAATEFGLNNTATGIPGLINAAGGSETRPRNQALPAFIKY